MGLLRSSLLPEEGRRWAGGRAADGYRVGIDNVDMRFARAHAQDVVAASPVPYVRAARVHGSVFADGEGGRCDDGVVSTVDTGFFIDHAEPDEALRSVLDGGCGGGGAWPWPWPFGRVLPEGHEFLVLVVDRGRGRRPVASGVDSP